MRGGAFGAPGFGLGKLLAFDRFLLGKATLLVAVTRAPCAADGSPKIPPRDPGPPVRPHRDGASLRPPVPVTLGA